jgi:hypothetical protein
LTEVIVTFSGAANAAEADNSALDRLTLPDSPAWLPAAGRAGTGTGRDIRAG